MHRTLKGALLASASFAVAATGLPAMAQDEDGIEEILVTATKRSATIQDVPFSINAQTMDDIQKSGATSLEDISRNVAGLTIQNLGPGQSQVAVRGVSAGQIVRDQPGVKEQVGVYLDESVISLSLFTPDLDLYDLNRVETLRGPQGTLFGSGSVGGTIRFITNQPDPSEREGMAEVNLNSMEDGSPGGHVKGYLNMPMGENSAMRIVAYRTNYGGFIDALSEGGYRFKDVNDGSRTGGRVAFRFEGDTYTVTPRLIYQEIESNGFNRQEVFNLYGNPYTTLRPAITFNEREQYLRLREKFTDETMIADLTIEAGYDAFDFVSVTSFTERDILVSRDASALTGSVSVDLGYPWNGIMLASNLRDTTALEQFTQEARISSNDDRSVQWLFGVFYSDTDRKYAQRLPTPGYDVYTDIVFGPGTSAAVANGYGADSPFNSDLPYSLQQRAIFGEATFEFTERLKATAGGRWYDYDEVRTITSGGLFANGDSGTLDTTSSTGFTPRFMLSYEMSDAVTWNAQAAQGFRLGGVNDPLNPALCTPADAAIFGGFQDYDDETLWNYEAGVKVKKPGLTFNAAAFHTNIENLQVTLDAGSCSSRVSFNTDAHTSGFEFELAAQPFEGWDFSINGSLIEAEFDEDVRDGTGTILAGIRKGNRLASVPEFQLSANATYSWAMTMADGGDALAYVNASVQHVGDRITQPSDQEPGAGDFASGLPFAGATGLEVTSLDLVLDSYTLLNLTAGIEFDCWELQGYITNVTDENVNLSFDRERGGRARLGFRTNQPRTIGLTVRWKFN